MKNILINLIKTKMKPYLDEIQIYQLNINLKVILNDFEIFKKDKILPIDESKENQELLITFLSAKQIEGCSERTIADVRFIKFKN